MLHSVAQNELFQIPYFPLYSQYLISYNNYLCKINFACLQLSARCNIVVKIIQDKVFSQAKTIRKLFDNEQKGKYGSMFNSQIIFEPSFWLVNVKFCKHSVTQRVVVTTVNAFTSRAPVTTIQLRLEI